MSAVGEIEVTGRNIMAASLVEGLEYPLSSNSFSNSNKTAFHVKLTDSALRAIEEFQKLKVSILKIRL